MPKKTKTTPQHQRFQRDLVSRGLLIAGEEWHIGAPITIGERHFRWVDIGVEYTESVIQADFYAKRFQAKRHYAVELNEQTGEILAVQAVGLQDFKIPYKTQHFSWKAFLRSVSIDIEDEPRDIWLYWTPAGDEMMVGYKRDQGTLEFDGYWVVWKELEAANPAVFWNQEIAPLLGSSEEDGTHVLLFKHGWLADWQFPVVYLVEKKFIHDYY